MCSKYANRNNCSLHISCTFSFYCGAQVMKAGSLGQTLSPTYIFGCTGMCVLNQTGNEQIQKWLLFLNREFGNSSKSMPPQSTDYQGAKQVGLFSKSAIAQQRICCWLSTAETNIRVNIIQRVTTAVDKVVQSFRRFFIKDVFGFQERVKSVRIKNL